MLSDVMEHFGLSKSFGQVTDFETDHHRQLLKDLKIAIREGGLIALTGIVGSGKTVLLGRLQEQLRAEGQLRSPGRTEDLHNQLLAAGYPSGRSRVIRAQRTGDGVKGKAQSIVRSSLTSLLLNASRGGCNQAVIT